MRITGRQLRQIIQEEVERMMSEVDYLPPGLANANFNKGTITGGTVSMSPSTGPEVRMMHTSEPATAAEATAAWSKVVAGGSSELPGVLALEADSSIDPATGNYSIPLSFKSGVFTFAAKIGKDTSDPSNVHVVLTRALSATVDGKSSPGALQALQTSPHVTIPDSSKNPSGFESSQTADAKFTVVVSSTPVPPRERRMGSLGDAIPLWRKITVQSAKFEPAGSAAPAARKR